MSECASIFTHASNAASNRPRKGRRLASLATVLIAAATLGACGSSSMTSSSGGTQSAESSTPPATEVNDGSQGQGPCVNGASPDLGVAGSYVHVTGALGSSPAIEAVCGAPTPKDLIVTDLVKGSGATVPKDGVVTAHYVGYGMSSRTIFDSSWPKGQPLQFSLRGVIPGWTFGLPGMKVGGRRLLIIPGALAYGPNPPTPVIAPDETLVFVVDLVSTP